MQRPFEQVDVFTATPCRGNPLAVVLDAQGLSDEEMARFARWTNLSETTFVFPPADPRADYRVRIFTGSGELAFAGHPTLGTCHVWLRSGAGPRDPAEIVQECGVGLVRIRRSGAQLAFAAPPRARTGPVAPELLPEIADQLAIAADSIVALEWADNGPGWIAVLLATADDVLAIRPNVRGALKLGVVGPYPEGSECAFEVRAFFPGASGDVFEDPVTGSLNASLAQWLIGSGRAPGRYVASQGSVLGRAGRVHIEQIDADIWVGGQTISCISGTVELSSS